MSSSCVNEWCLLHTIHIDVEIWILFFFFCFFVLNSIANKWLVNLGCGRKDKTKELMVIIQLELGLTHGSDKELLGGFFVGCWW